MFHTCLYTESYKILYVSSIKSYKISEYISFTKMLSAHGNKPVSMCYVLGALPKWAAKYVVAAKVEIAFYSVRKRKSAAAAAVAVMIFTLTINTFVRGASLTVTNITVAFIYN